MTSLRNFLEDNKFHRFPLQKLRTGHYKITLLVNGKKGRFIVDTGASTSCIGLANIAYFKLEPQESDIKAAGAGATNMATLLVKNISLQLKSIRLRNQDFVLFDLTHVNSALEQVSEKPIEGILGADLLKELRAVIDYGRNCLYIKTP